MLYIRYTLKSSDVHGIGLFADQPIKQGSVIYTASPALDLNISQETFDGLAESEKDEIRYWGFLDHASGLWHVDFDVSKFINHSNAPTVSQDQTHADAYLIATRDIESGEELTQDYREFETEEDLRRRGIVDV